MSSFTIVVDSSCDLPAELMAKYGIEVLPIPFDLDGRSHVTGDWKGLTVSLYYDSLRKGKIAKTSQINPDDFTEAYSSYANDNRDALFISLSSGLSPTWHNSEIALNEIKKKYPNSNIYTVDSLNATTGHGLLTLLAVKKRDEGLTAGETAAWLNEKKHSLFGLFTVDDLMYLHRGGRLSRMSAITGSVFHIKPVLNMAPDGTLCMKEKVQGRDAALNKLISQLERSINPGTSLDTVLIAHSDCLEYAQALVAKLTAVVRINRIIIMPMCPVIGAHVGPGTVNLMFEADMTRQQYEDRFSS